MHLLARMHVRVPALSVCPPAPVDVHEERDDVRAAQSGPLGLRGRERPQRGVCVNCQQTYGKSLQLVRSLCCFATEGMGLSRNTLCARALSASVSAYVSAFCPHQVRGVARLPQQPPGEVRAVPACATDSADGQQQRGEVSAVAAV